MHKEAWIILIYLFIFVSKANAGFLSLKPTKMFTSRTTSTFFEWFGEVDIEPQVNSILVKDVFDLGKRKINLSGEKNYKSSVKKIVTKWMKYKFENTDRRYNGPTEIEIIDNDDYFSNALEDVITLYLGPVGKEVGDYQALLHEQRVLSKFSFDQGIPSLFNRDFQLFHVSINQDTRVCSLIITYDLSKKDSSNRKNYVLVLGSCIGDIGEAN